MAPTLLGLVGDPVAHSVSPAMQQAALDALGLPWQYHAERVPAGEFSAQLARLARRYRGLNVTRPHKLVATQACDSLTPAARRTGSVNTLTFERDTVLGDSTDGAGMLAALAEAGVRFAPADTLSPPREAVGRAVVLGTGGAARAAAAAFVDAGLAVVVVGRNEAAGRDVIAALAETARERGVHLSLLVPPMLATTCAEGTSHTEGRASTSAADAAELQAHCDLLQRALDDASVLVNATPVGGSDTPGDPLPIGVKLDAGTAVLDMIYAPRRTPLLGRAQAAGCATIEGVEMLVHQGARSLAIWTGLEPPIATMRAAACAALDAAASVSLPVIPIPSDGPVHGSAKIEEVACCDS